MTDINLTELRRVAEAATPGPWEVEGQGPGPDAAFMGCGVVYTMGPGVEGGNIARPAGDCYPRGGYSPREDMTHIATFDPPTVLALLSEVERLRGVVERVEGLADSWSFTRSRSHDNDWYAERVRAAMEGGEPRTARDGVSVSPEITTTMHDAGEVDTSLGFDPPGYYAKGR